MPRGWFFKCVCMNSAIKLAMASIQNWWCQLIFFIVGLTLLILHTFVVHSEAYKDRLACSVTVRILA